MKKLEGTEVIEIIHYSRGDRQVKEDQVIVEFPVTIYLNGEEFITLLCSPKNLDYLAVGFLISEGFIQKKEDLKSLDYDEEKGQMHVGLKQMSALKQKLYGKRTVTTGCGKGTIFYHVLDSMGTKKIEVESQFSPKGILQRSKELNQLSGLFKETGGVHFCGLCTENAVIIFHEDIGRHNAVDKIVGEAFMNDVSLEDKMLITSGRITSEMLIKAGKINIPVVISRSAPTKLSVELAKDLNITLIGFARGERLNIYHGEERITL